MNSEKPNTSPPENGVKKHKKASKRILAGLVIIAFCLIVWGICALSTSLMKVKSITVNGQSPYSVEDIIEASGIKNGEIINRVDKSGAVLNIQRKLAYISEVKIKVGMFGKVSITVTYDTAVYYTKIAGRYYALSGEFRLLEMSEHKQIYESARLIFLELPKIKTAMLGNTVEYYDESSGFVPLLMKDLNASVLNGKMLSVNASDRYTIEVECERFSVKIGVYRDMQTKLNLVEKMLTAPKLSEASSAVLDVADPANGTIRTQN